MYLLIVFVISYFDYYQICVLTFKLLDFACVCLQNRMVLRLALFLVEAGFFEEVEFVFLIVGHTKNPCDRCFNLLKKEHRGSNIYSMDQLMAKLNKGDGVVAHTFEHHADWEKKLSTLYKNFSDTGIKLAVKKNHNFFVEEVDGETMMKVRVSMRPEDEWSTPKSFRKVSLDQDDRDELLREDPDLLPQPGIRKIKLVELQTKWAELIPDDCKGPNMAPGVIILSPEELEAFRKEKNTAKTAKKKANEQEELNNVERQREMDGDEENEADEEEDESDDAIFEQDAAVVDTNLIVAAPDLPPAWQLPDYHPNVYPLRYPGYFNFES